MLQLNGFGFALSDLRRYVKTGGFVERSAKRHAAVTGNAKKGSPNLSVKPEWLCLQHRQAWSRPQSPVKWESAETGQGWTLQRRSSVERTYRECERPATAGGGGQNQPGCASAVLWEPPQLHYHQDSSAYRTHPGNKPLQLHQCPALHWSCISSNITVYIVHAKGFSSH